MKKFLIFALLLSAALNARPIPVTIITPTGGVNPQNETEEIVHNFYSALQSGDADEIKGLLAQGYQVEDLTEAYDSNYSKFAAFSKDLTTRATALSESLSDLKVAIVNLFSSGNEVVAQVKITGLQKGSFLGAEPTGKPVIIKMLSVFTIENGKIGGLVESWNELSVMKQIDFIAL